jgi:hypothetical protein
MWCRSDTSLACNYVLIEHTRVLHSVPSGTGKWKGNRFIAVTVFSTYSYFITPFIKGKLLPMLKHHGGIAFPGLPAVKIYIVVFQVTTQHSMMREMPLLL